MKTDKRGGRKLAVKTDKRGGRDEDRDRGRQSQFKRGQLEA